MWTEPMHRKIASLGRWDPRNSETQAGGGGQLESPNRRRFLQNAATGFGGLALAAMLQREAGGQEAGTLKVLHHPAKAKRVVQLFMAGAASHIDLWDHKPLLKKLHGQESDFGEPVEAFQNGLGPWMQSPFEFSRYGQSGKMISEAVQPLGECVDDMAFIHNMVGKTGVHSQATLLQSTGFQTWVSGYGVLGELCFRLD